MKQTTFTVKYDEEKLNAIRQYMGKKNVDFEGELAEVMGKLYEKYVPQAVREYIDSREETPPGKAVREKKMPPTDAGFPKIRWLGREISRIMGEFLGWLGESRQKKGGMLWGQMRIRPNFPHGWIPSSWSWPTPASGTGQPGTARN